MSLISSFKGWVGEMQGTLAAKIRLDSQVYRSINNVTIPTANGTTQIDHVIVSRYGIFVVETKNIKGWIYVIWHGKFVLFFIREDKITLRSSAVALYSALSYRLRKRVVRGRIRGLQKRRARP